ncbi:hypothetical protein SAMN04488109_1326 [Chryseolinea serpens]|uniref:Uncharacterized protein n=2 Tax=Chryseolinea serpens TaxID=947013 RepID=A0A1M5LRC5_9BACT|nr:hypothetical protein SAMN04488109_1326 [Chryseolinea serpens]
MAMTNATERKILRWVHIIASVPIVGYIYGPVAERPEAVIVVRFILFPAVVLTGLWMWKGMWLKNWWKKKIAMASR